MSIHREMKSNYSSVHWNTLSPQKERKYAIGRSVDGPRGLSYWVKSEREREMSCHLQVESVISFKRTNL